MLFLYQNVALGKATIISFTQQVWELVLPSGAILLITRAGDGEDDEPYPVKSLREEGFYAERAMSRSFLVQVPLTVIGFFNVYFVMDLPAIESSNWTQKLRKVDFGGALTLILAVCALLVGLHEGANVSWDSPVAIVCLSVSVPLFALFVLVEVRYVAEPFAPRHVLFDRTLLACSLCNFFAASTWLAISYYLPLYWQAVEHLSATQAALRLLPGIIANVSGSLFAGVVSGQFLKW